MMEAIEKCLDLVDEPTMSKLVLGIESSIQQSVGMPSKVSVPILSQNTDMLSYLIRAINTFKAY